MVTRFIEVQTYVGEQKEQARPRCLEKAAVLPRVCPAAELVYSVSFPPDTPGLTLLHNQRGQLQIVQLPLWTKSSFQPAGPHPCPPSPPKSRVAAPTSPPPPIPLLGLQQPSSVSASFQPAQLPPSPLHRPLFVFCKKISLSSYPISVLAFPSQCSPPFLVTFFGSYCARLIALLLIWLLLLMHLVKNLPLRCLFTPNPISGVAWGKALKNLINLNLLSGSVLWNPPQLIFNCLL